jgi:hypothetical protein
MDSDEDLLAAMQSGCTFELVRVLAVARDKAGTRSQTASYECEVLRSIEEAASAPTRLTHFGVPLLEAGRSYVVGVVDSNRHQGAWGLLFASPAVEHPEQAVADFLSRRATLVP